MSGPVDPQKALWKEYFEEAASKVEEQTEAEPSPPQWPMFSGVFDFPWWPDTFPTWMGMSIGLTLNGLGVYSLMYAVGKLGVIGMRALGLPVTVLTLLVLAFCSTICLHVIRETGNGADRIKNWPRVDWREWVWSLISVLYVLLVCALVGYGVRLLVLPFVDTWIPTAAVTLLLFPIVLLSSLEAASPWMPFSPPVLRSLVVVWSEWLIFYGIAIGLCGAWGLAEFVGVVVSRWSTALVVMPLLAAILLICARMLGRVAWSMGQAYNRLSSVENEG